MATRKIFIYAFLLILNAVVVCANEKVTLQLRWDHQFQFSGYYAAKWQGFYDDVGLDVTIKPAISNETILSAVDEVLDERADFGIGAADILKARDDGAPLVIIASIFQSSAAAFYARSDTQIESPADFVNFRIARKVNDLIDIEFQAMLRAEGIDPDLVTPYPHTPGVARLISKEVDLVPGYSISVPYTAKTSGLLIKEFKPIDYGIDFYGDTIFTRQAFIKTNPELVERFKAASIKGWKYALSNKDEIIAKITGNLKRTESVYDVKEFNAFQSDRIERLIHYPVVEIGHINPFRWRRMHDHLKSVGLVSNPIDIDTLIYDPEKIAKRKAARTQKFVAAVVLILFSAFCLALMGALFLKRAVHLKTKALRHSNEKLKQKTHLFEESKNRLVAAQKVAKVWDWTWEAKTDTVFWSEEAYSAFDLTPGRSDVIMDTFQNAVHPEDRGKFMSQRNLAFNQKRKIKTEYRIILPGHDVRTVHEVSSIERHDDGHATKMIGTIQDITERKKTEKKLKQREELFRAVFEQAGGFCMLLEPTQTGIPVIRDANKAACDMHGYRHKELSGRFISDLIKEEKHASIERTKAIIAGQTITLENNHVRKDGSIFPVEIIANKIGFADDRKPLILLTGFDITDKKKAAKEKLKMEQRLHQAQKMESIGNLAGGIAHDFNNLLFPIIGMSELLTEDLKPDSTEYEYAKAICNAGKRAGALVKQILAFSRQSEQRLIPVQLQRVLDEVIKLCRSTIPTNIEIHKKFQKNSGFILADMTQIHQIGMNLITNAYHAVQDKNGKILVELKQISINPETSNLTSVEPGEYLLLSVSDNGKGMTREVKDKIFEPYFTTKKQGKGTGLGLAVVYGIVKEYGGHIHVRTKPGKGTTFKIYFPLMDKQTYRISEQEAKPAESGNEHILIVDDEVTITSLQEKFLNRLGYQVTSRNSSIDALEEFKAHPDSFDLIIADMSMPDLTGDQLAEEIKKIRPDMAIIICSGFSERINKEKADRIGIDEFLPKPVVKSEFTKAVRKVLNKSKKGESS